jgi:hypothetical protein
MKKYDDFKKDKDALYLTKEEMATVKWTKYVIVVPTEEDRNELMEAFEHIHYSDIDTDNIAVNQLAHEYLDDDREPGTYNNIVGESIHSKKYAYIFICAYILFIFIFTSIFTVTCTFVFTFKLIFIFTCIFIIIASSVHTV